MIQRLVVDIDPELAEIRNRQPIKVVGSPAALSNRVDRRVRSGSVARRSAGRSERRFQGPAGRPLAKRPEVPGGQFPKKRRCRVDFLLMGSTSSTHIPRPCVAMTITLSRGWTMRSWTYAEGRFVPIVFHVFPPSVVT